jgi:hypothetical protein
VISWDGLLLVVLPVVELPCWTYTYVVAAPSLYLSHPSHLLDSVDGGGSIVVPLDGSHGNLPGQVLCVDAGDGQNDSFLSGDVLLSISSTLALLNDSGSIVVPLDGGHSGLPCQVLSVAAGASKDDPLISGDVLLSISPTPALLAVALMTEQLLAVFDLKK